MAKIFTPEFNQFETLNATQAWSLFFTVSSSDKVLGSKPLVGRFITLGLFSSLFVVILQTALHSL